MDIKTYQTHKQTCYQTAQEQYSSNLELVVAEMKLKVDSNIHKMLLNNIIPFEVVENASFRYGLIDFKTGFICLSPVGKASFRNAVSREIGEVIATDDYDNMLMNTLHLGEITRNPFKPWGFAKDSDTKYGVQWNLNNILYSPYMDKLEPIAGDADIDLLLKLYRNGDSETHKGFSFFETLVAHQIFHDEKVMGVAVAYSKAHGSGKSFLASIGEYLYSESNKHSFFPLVEVLNTSSDWGDNKNGIRTYVIDDAPDVPEITAKLTASIKGIATSQKAVSVNIKGKGIVSATSYNQYVTTNWIDAIPLEKDGRRVYPVSLDKSILTPTELQKIEDLDIPMVGNTKKHHDIVQKMLNHLYYVYINSVGDKKLDHKLNKEVPTSEFKKQVIAHKKGEVKTIQNMIETATTIDMVKTQVVDELELSDKALDFLHDEEFAVPVIKNEMWFLFLSIAGIKKVGQALNNGYPLSTNETLSKFFPNFTVSTTRINKGGEGGATGGVKKGISIPLPNYNGSNLEEMVIMAGDTTLF